MYGWILRLCVQPSFSSGQKGCAAHLPNPARGVGRCVRVCDIKIADGNTATRSKNLGPLVDTSGCNLERLKSCSSLMIFRIQMDDHLSDS